MSRAHRSRLSLLVRESLHNHIFTLLGEENISKVQLIFLISNPNFFLNHFPRVNARVKLEIKTDGTLNGALLTERCFKDP